MPPRVRSARFSSYTPSSSSPLAPSCPHIRPQHSSLSTPPSRHFSHTPCQQVTLRRRRFYEWMNGPGLALKEPLPNSTNYLGAYDKFGNLVRAPIGWQRDGDKAPKAPEQEASQDENAAEEAAPSDEEKVDELEAAVQSDEAKAQDAKLGDESKGNAIELPPETAEDLQPFPLNPFFRSQPVLSEDLREAIYRRVKRDGATVSLASVEFGVSNERVGAVVRLKQMEKEWIAQGKTLAIPYSKAVMAMLPTTPFIDTSKSKNKGRRPVQHEPINDLIVHPATRQQLFVPVAESRHFTRVDAGKAFASDLLPADDRIPHPELVQAEREREAGLSFDERRRLAEERLAAESAKKLAEEREKEEEARRLKVVPQRRWDFVFRDVNVDKAGRDGRGVEAAGWRYGVPHQDRKRGIRKIPTQVEA